MLKMEWFCEEPVMNNKVVVSNQTMIDRSNRVFSSVAKTNSESTSFTLPNSEWVVR